MKLGTKSILFGVHQFLWHPITVVRAWRFYYGRWPTVEEFLCIAVHDLGYWGCAEIDGAEGRQHPKAGGRIAAKLVYWWNRFLLRGHREAGARWLWAFGFVVTHSKNYAYSIGVNTGPLYAPDKLSILFDPMWFYLLRAKLSGELDEYIKQSPWKYPGNWLRWYCNKVRHENKPSAPGSNS